MKYDSGSMDRAPFFSVCPVCVDAGRREVVAFPELVFVRCQGCGLIYKSEQRPGLGQGYESEYFLWNGGNYTRRWAHRVRKCRRQLHDCLQFVGGPPARLLDIGCSAGYVLEAAKSLGLEATGLDYSAFAVKLCRERGFQAVEGSLTDLPFPDGSFDLITLKAVLEHVPDPMAGLREAKRVLRPGGVILLVVPDGDYLKNWLVPRTGRNFRPDARGWQHHVYFRSGSLAQACQQVGLRVAHEGKAVWRPRSPWCWPVEWIRYGSLAAWSFLSRTMLLRRDIHAFLVKP